MSADRLPHLIVEGFFTTENYTAARDAAQSSHCQLVIRHIPKTPY